MTPPVLTQNEVARQLGVSRQRVKRLREQGRLTAHWNARSESWEYDPGPVVDYARQRDAFRERTGNGAPRPQLPAGRTISGPPDAQPGP